jgi:hypothetical protein
MNRVLKILFLFALVFCISCASKKNVVSDNSSFRIDYSAGGGFSGLIKGITIFSNGNGELWKRLGTDSLLSRDSIKLNDTQLTSFKSILQDSALFRYKLNNTGNIATKLIIQKNNSRNEISFGGTIPPDNMPEKLIDLINQIKKLYSNKKD